MKYLNLELLVGLLPADLQPKAKAIAAALLAVLGVVSMFEKWSWVAVATAVISPVAVHQVPNLTAESKGNA